MAKQKKTQKKRKKTKTRFFFALYYERFNAKKNRPSELGVFPPAREPDNLEEA
jgi:hypothetical protein